MMRLLLLILAGAALAAPARAADVAGLACPLGRLSAAERTGLDQFILALGERTDPRRAPFDRAVESCGRSLGWSPRAATLASQYNLAAAMTAILQARLASRGIDVAAIERLLLADPVVMDPARPIEQQGPAIQAFVARHGDLFERMLAGQPAREQTGQWIGVFLVGRATLVIARAQFGENGR